MHTSFSYMQFKHTNVSIFPLFNIPLTCIFKLKYIIVHVLLHVHCVLSQNCILHLSVDRLNNSELRNDTA